jgi:hypothetical protein
MRTTIRIDDGLYRAVKMKAARSGRTIAAVLEDAVRRGLEPSQPIGSIRYQVRPTGAGGLQPGVDISTNGGLAEVLDEGVSIDVLR